MTMESNINLRGRLAVKKISAPKAPLSWKLKNTLNPGHIGGTLAWHLGGLFSRVTGFPVLRGRLSVRFFGADGRVIDYGVVCHKVVTNAFVNFMVDQLQAETTEWGDFKYHDSGVGVTAPAVGDTDIETTDGEARATGSQTEGASTNIYKSVGTIAYTTTKAITEHGLFSQSTGTTLMDRSTFTAINVVNGDSIEFTYELTCTAGG